MAIPIAALDPAIGAILGHLLINQKLNGRKAVGIAVCFLASALIGSGGAFTPGSMVALGCVLALVAAASYGFEGCVIGYSTSVVDPEIAVTLRECTSALVNILVLLPVLAIIAGDVTLAPTLLGAAWSSGSALPLFLVSGMFSMISYLTWYKGNSMCEGSRITCDALLVLGTSSAGSPGYRARQARVGALSSPVDRSGGDGPRNTAHSDGSTGTPAHESYRRGG